MIERGGVIEGDAIERVMVKLERERERVGGERKWGR